MVAASAKIGADVTSAKKEKIPCFKKNTVTIHRITANTKKTKRHINVCLIPFHMIVPLFSDQKKFLFLILHPVTALILGLENLFLLFGISYRNINNLHSKPLFFLFPV